MTSPVPESKADERDARLACLLETIAADARAGRAPDFERLAREHPDLSGELRELWAAVMVADAVALGSSQDGQGHAERGHSITEGRPIRSDLHFATGDLPRRA